ncbi:hypothetical protein HY988_00875 [Candidatus Micrarchaeota archaeon]|nr:hypothetical protein [Candidatus Micrarchaeota archaeon]
MPNDEKASPTSAKKPTLLDQATNLISPTIEFGKKNFKDLFVKMLKVQLLSSAVAVLLLIIFGLLTLGFLLALGISTSKGFEIERIFASVATIVALVVWAVFALLVFGIVNKTITLTRLKIIKCQYEGTYPGIRKTFGEILVPVIKASVIDLIINAVALGIPIIILVLLASMPLVLVLGIFVFIIYAILFIVIYRFFAQFWYWELVIDQNDAYTALMRSISLVKSDIVAVLIYDIIEFFGAVIISIPFIILSTIVEIIFRAGALVSALASPLGGIAIVGLLIPYIIFKVVVALVQSGTSDVFVLPYKYSFWMILKNAPKEDTKQKTTPESKQLKQKTTEKPKNA